MTSGYTHRNDLKTLSSNQQRIVFPCKHLNSSSSKGIPAREKTSTAQFVQQWLEERGIATQLFLEGDLHHPADYECVAHFTRAAYDDLLAAWPEARPIIEANTTIHGDDCFIGYCLCMQQSKLPEVLCLRVGCP